MANLALQAQKRQNIFKKKYQYYKDWYSHSTKISLNMRRPKSGISGDDLLEWFDPNQETLDSKNLSYKRAYGISPVKHLTKYNFEREYFPPPFRLQIKATILCKTVKALIELLVLIVEH